MQENINLNRIKVFIGSLCSSKLLYDYRMAYMSLIVHTDQFYPKWNYINI